MNILKCNLNKHCHGGCKYMVEIMYCVGHEIRLCKDPAGFFYADHCSEAEVVELIEQSIYNELIQIRTKSETKG